MYIVIKFERVIKSDKILSLEKIQNIFPPSIFRSNFFSLFSLSLSSLHFAISFRVRTRVGSPRVVTRFLIGGNAKFSTVKWRKRV